MAGGSFVRISSLICADILVVYAFFIMQNYLTDVWKLSFTHAAAILNIWSGICMVLPGFFLWFVEAFLGHFGMLVLSSIAYSSGIILVFLSTPSILASSIGQTQKVLFYIGMTLVAVGMSGNKVSLQPFLEKQLGVDPNRRFANTSAWQIPGYVVVVVTAVVGAIALPYIKPWSIRFGIPAIFTVLGTLLFLTGCCCWKYDIIPINGSPLTNVLRVFVAFAKKMFRSYELNNRNYKQDPLRTMSFTPTRCLRWLHKAAMYGPGDDVGRTWRFCTVAEVEEAKIALRMIPMWMTFITCGIVSSIGNTYFVEQANHLNRKIGKWNVPLQILLLLSETSKSFFDSCANRYLYVNPAAGAQPDEVSVPIEGRRPAVGIGSAMILSVLCCITAARIEMKRLDVIRHNGLLDKPDDAIPMRVYWLLFQFILLAGVNSFIQKSVVAFYALQAPESMKNYLGHFTKGVSGLGYMFNVLTVYLVGRVRPHWFQFTLNKSRLDKYYWFLAALSAVNFVIFVPIALFYRYRRTVEVRVNVELAEGAFCNPEIGEEQEDNAELVTNDAATIG